MKNNKRQRKAPNRWGQLSKRRSNESRTNESINFGSSKSYVEAFSKIYYQEINDIDRFVSFATAHYSSKSK